MESLQIEFGSRSSFVHLHREGRTERSVPLWTLTADALCKWTRDQDKELGGLLFTNYRGERITRNGTDSILQKAVSCATDAHPASSGKHVSPHVVRHTTVMHLLQSGVDISVIMPWLDYEQLDTTHIQLEADLALKEKALNGFSQQDRRSEVRRDRQGDGKPREPVTMFNSAGQDVLHSMRSSRRCG